MRLLALFIIFALLLAGCFHDKGQPPQDSNVTIITPSDGKDGTDRTIIIIKNDTRGPIDRDDDNRDDNGLLPPPSVSKVTPGYTSTPEERFAIYFINVGKDELQGDAILIKKGDFDMLVDAGNVRSTNKVIDFLKSKAVDDLEVLVSTHADNEHYGGITAVLNEFGVEEFWWPGKLYGDSEYDTLVKKINSDGIPIKEVKRGVKFDFNGMTFEVLNPSATKSFGDRDNDAVVIKITQNEFCTLLTSDILGGVQNEIANLDGGNKVRCDILQAPGHGLGRATSQIDVFLLKVSPKDVIFSGSISDPAQDQKGTRFTIFEKLKIRNARSYENYKNGTVRIVSDGFTYAIDQLSN